MIRKSLSIIAGIALTTSVYAADQKTICGESDDRTPSYNPKVARALGSMTEPAGCTITMIGKTCAVSAGHCHTTFGFAEFNTPLSQNGRIQHPKQEDIYEIDKSTLVYKNGGMGDDYAVVRIKPNTLTGKYPGIAQGHYNVSFNMPAKGDMVRITGYGADYSDNDRNFAQQTHAGPIDSLNRGSSVMNHRADTMGGNSGSSIIHEPTGKIIAIHTHGGCYSRGGANASTLIASHDALKKAITSCLQWEENNL
ncbi:MAG: trypsin-like serine protease [Bacteriovoracaceae bacterium]|nr:trypsin-like serine protease [Bacteriovoracaceae bacterium]